MFNKKFINIKKRCVDWSNNNNITIIIIIIIILLITSEASKHFNNKKKECLRDKIYHFVINSKSKNIRDLHRGINEFKKGYQLINNLMVIYRIPT
jgi:hypothetical protein